MLVYCHNQIFIWFLFLPILQNYNLNKKLILRKIIAVLVVGIVVAFGSIPAEAAAPKVKIENKKLIDRDKVEDVVRIYFEDTPILAEIARCESRFTQFNSDGSIHQGVVNPSDIGVMQINRYYHLNTAKKMGLNLFSLEGNLAYAKFLYEDQGVAPWKASAPCWKKVSKLLLATTLR